MTSRAVYTAIAGDYNELRDHPEGPDGVDWIAYVTHPQKHESSNWDVRPLFSYGESDERQQVEWYKVQSQLEMAEYDRTVWIEGEVIRPEILADVMRRDDEDERDAPIRLYRNTERHCVYQEAGYFVNQFTEVRDQMNYYLDVYDYPENAGLWDTSVIVRNRCSDVERLERQWWGEVEHWRTPDQLSLPIVLRSGDVAVSTLKVSFTA